MVASKFTDARKVLIVKRDKDGTPVAKINRRLPTRGPDH